MFALIRAGINACVNSREAGDLRRHRAHYDIIVMVLETLRWVTLIIPDVPSTTRIP